MQFKQMVVTAVCVLFLLKIRMTIYSIRTAKLWTCSHPIFYLYLFIFFHVN